MAYRGLEHPITPCYRHSAAQATESCARCLQAICDICVGFENTQPHCPPCAKKVRARRALGRAMTAALGLAVAAATLGGVVWLVSRERSFDYGIHTGEVHALTGQLAAEPCDRPVALALTETMLRAGDYRGVLGRIATFGQKCGEWPRLLWVSYSAHERLSEHDAAIVDATRLIALSPDDKDFWWWRAIAQEEKGELDAAVAGYRRSLELEPRMTGIPFNLANLLERQGRYCEAMAPLNDFLRYHPDVSDRVSVETRLDRLSRLCQPTK
jgi:tetratricopeptide (TPR) repeat protein